MRSIRGFGRNKKELHKARKEIEIYLNEKLDLKMKDNWQVFRFHYICRKTKKDKGRFLDFMGFKFYRNRTTLRKSIIKRILRKTNKIKKKEKITWYDSCQLISYLGWISKTDTYGYYKRFIKDKINIKKMKRKISERSNYVYGKL